MTLIEITSLLTTCASGCALVALVVSGRLRSHKEVAWLTFQAVLWPFLFLFDYVHWGQETGCGAICAVCLAAAWCALRAGEGALHQFPLLWRKVRARCLRDVLLCGVAGFAMMRLPTDEHWGYRGMVPVCTASVCVLAEVLHVAGRDMDKVHEQALTLWVWNLGAQACYIALWEVNPTDAFFFGFLSTGVEVLTALAICRACLKIHWHPRAY